MKRRGNEKVKIQKSEMLKRIRSVDRENEEIKEKNVKRKKNRQKAKCKEGMEKREEKYTT